MKAKNTWKLYLTSIGVWVLPAVALAATPRTFRELVIQIIAIINYIIPTIIVLGLVIYFWGIVRNILIFGQSGKEAAAEARKRFFGWGLLILFVMVSIWGILRLLVNTFL